MKSFYLTDAGKVRDHNEDSVIIVKNNEGSYLMAIADGMGGHSAGEVASSIAIGYLGKHFKETFINTISSYAVMKKRWNVPTDKWNYGICLMHRFYTILRENCSICLM